MINTIIQSIEEHSRGRKKATLTPMKTLLEILNHPEKDLRVIHVGGTNGKGSVCAMIESVLLENRYKVGAFQSPHVERFAERIRFEGVEIPESDLKRETQRAVVAVKKMVERGHGYPTEFELITAIAFLYFQKKNPDFVILEVGLGGKTDPTNVIEKPCITTITSVDLDHMNRLGNTLEKIAGEKAGIIKKGVPVVSYVEDQEAAKVVAQKAYEQGSLFVHAVQTSYTIEEINLEGQRFSTEIQGQPYNHVFLKMLGEHQIANGITALTTIEILRKNSIIKVEKEALYKGLSQAVQKGRLEVVEKNPAVILDGAHNPEGMAGVVKFVDDYFYGKKILTIVGGRKDKPMQKMIEMAMHLGQDFLATQPADGDAFPAEIIDGWLRNRGKNSRIVKGIPSLIEVIRQEQRAKNYQAILVVGSFYLIGDVRRSWKNDHCETKTSDSVL